MASPQEVYRGLVQRGLTPAQAWGIVANTHAESGLNPGINERNPVVPGSRGGFGLNQWTGPRRDALEDYMAQRGLPVDDLEGQLDFTLHELQGPEKAAYAKLQAADTPEEAAYAYSKYFLRPGHDNTDYRVSLASRMASGDFTTDQLSPGNRDMSLASLGEEVEPHVRKRPRLFAKQHAALTDRLGIDEDQQLGLGGALRQLGLSLME